MKSLLLIALLLCGLNSLSQCKVDKNGDPVNVRGDLNILAAGCCCDYSWKSVSTTPPTTAANATRFNLTADSLFINIATLGSQNMDTVFFKMNQRKGSRMLFTLQTNTVVFADVELIAGSGVDMGTWWKFAIDYFDRPTTFIMDKVYCVEYGYGVSIAPPNGITWQETLQASSTLTQDNYIDARENDLSFDNLGVFGVGSGTGTQFGFFALDSTATGWQHTHADTNTHINMDYQSFIVEHVRDTDVTRLEIGNGVFRINTSVANPLIDDNTLIRYGDIKPVHGSGPPATAPAYEGLHYIDDATLPAGVYYSIGTSSAADWVLFN